MRSVTYSRVFEQNGGVEAGVAVSDVQSTVVGHFLLQGADVRWGTEGGRGGGTQTVYLLFLHFIRS